MGTQYNYECACGYMTTVCGGSTGIRNGSLYTVWCQKCKRVYDKSVIRVIRKMVNILIREVANIQIRKSGYIFHLERDGNYYSFPPALQDSISKLTKADLEAIILEEQNLPKTLIREVKDIKVIKSKYGIYLKRGLRVYNLNDEIQSKVLQLTKDEIEAIISDKDRENIKDIASMPRNEVVTCKVCDSHVIPWPTNHPCPKCAREMKQGDVTLVD